MLMSPTKNISLDKEYSLVVSVLLCEDPLAIEGKSLRYIFVQM